MLNVAVIRSVAYYLDQVAQSRSDYYLGRGEAPGRWRGALAGALGLGGTVHPDHLRALLEGRNPTTGEPLLATRHDGRRGRAATGSGGADTLTADAAAQALGVSVRTLRRWVAAGSAAWREADAAAPNAELRSPGDVLARLTELGSPTIQPTAPTCLLVPPATGPRRRLEIPVAEVERLQQARRPPSSRQGYDVVFRPAKGWSVLWAVGPKTVRDELRRIHHEAVADALVYLEDTAARGRATVPWRGRRVRMRARGDGFIAACFDHRESRAGDPLLHTHCLIANVTRLPDGRLGALEASALFRQQRAADAVYRATFLRLASQRLGIRPAAVDDPFPEPDGVPRSVIEHFSKRSEEISEEVARHGSASAAARQLAALATRRAKEVASRSEDLHTRWRTEAEAAGFGPSEVAACLGHATVTPPTTPERAALEAFLAAPDGLTEKAATFFRGDALRAIVDALPGALSGPEAIEAADAFLASSAVIQVREHRAGRPRGRVLDTAGVVDDLALCRFSVPELAESEARLISAADRRSGPVVGQEAVEQTLARLGHLSQEQASMVRAVSESPDLLRPVVGLPGSGKTTATTALVTAYQAAAVPVLGCAVTATAADQLKRATGLMACDTLARTLIDLQSPGGALAPGTVVIADEASMLPTRALDRLVAHVEAAGGAIVLVGDPHQHPAVGPGSFFTWLATAREAPALAGNLRQVGEHADLERGAAAALRKGAVAASVELRDEAGLLTRATTPAELHGRLVADWHEQWVATRDPMIAASNDTRARLNTAARALLDDAGVLHGPSWATPDGHEFRAGDWVVARHNDRRLRPEANSTFWVRNGSCGEILAVDAARGRIVVDFAGPGTASHRVSLPARYVDSHLEHGYALTDYGVQGRTLSRSLAVLDEASTLAGTYVATTRGRHENRLYVATVDAVDSDNLDVTHGIPRIAAPSLNDLTTRVAARRPDDLLHDHDPNIHPATQLAQTRTVDDLQEELQRLDAALADVPNDQTAGLQSAVRARSHLQERAECIHESDPAREDLVRRIARLDASIGGLSLRQAQREEALRGHEDSLARRAVLRDAVAMRTLTDRLRSSAGSACRGVQPP